MGGMLQLKETEVFKIVKLKAKGRQTALQLIAPPPPQNLQGQNISFLKAWSSTIEVNDKKKIFHTILVSEGWRL